MRKLQNKTKIATIASILVLVTTMFVTLQPSSVAAQDQTSTPENWIELITQTPDGWRHIPGVTNYPWLLGPRGDSSNTGYTDSPAPHTNHVLWRDDIGFRPWCRMAIDHGTVYITNRMQNAVYAFDAYTGEVLWRYDDTSLYGWQTGLADGFVLLINGSQGIALSASSGTLHWTSTATNLTRMAMICQIGTVFPKDYAVYYAVLYEQASGGTGNKGVACYKRNPRGKMTEVWSSQEFTRSTAYYEGKLYGSDYKGQGITCVNATTGNFIWNFTLPGKTRNSYMSIKYDKVYAGMYYDGDPEVAENMMHCLDANTGKLLWQYITEGTFVQLQSVGYDRVYLLGAEENKLYCLDATTGTLLWSFEAAGVIDYYGPVTADGALYFNSATYTITGFPPEGSYPGYTYCINATTGEEIWKYPTPTIGTMTAIADGNFYVPTTFDYMWCWGAGPTTTTLMTTSTSLTLGQSTAVSGSVTDMSPFSQQHPELQSPLVAGVPVVLSYVNDGTWTDFATVNTDSAGTFMYNWSPSSEGAYKVVARFEGNDAYYWSSAQEVVQVGPAAASYPDYPEAPAYTTTDLAILAAVIIAVIIGAVSIYITRKQQK